jgi:hypothetical protein
MPDLKKYCSRYAWSKFWVFCMVVTRTFSDGRTDDRTMAAGASVTWMHCSVLFEVTWGKTRLVRADAWSCPRGHERVCADATMRPRGCTRVRADTSASARMQPSVRADMGVRTDASPSPPLSLPPRPSPSLPSPPLPSPLLSAQMLGCVRAKAKKKFKKNLKNYFLLL